MIQIPAIAVREVVGSSVTTDGAHLLLTLIQGDGSELILAIPRSEILKLAQVAAVSHAQSSKILNVDPNHKPVFRVTWWELGFDKTTNSVVLTLTFDGGKLSFQLWGNMPKAILETLQVHVGGATPQVPGPRN